LAVENFFDLLQETFAQITAETIQLLPKIFIALIVIAITFVVIKVLNYFFKKVLKLTKLDAMFKRFAGFSLPFTIDGLVIFLADLGVALIAIYALINVFIGPQYLQLMNEGLYFGARIVSIVVISIIFLTIFNLLVSRIQFENRLRSYAMLIVLLLITAMLIDLTTLSEPVKQALTTGLSLGVGISIGVFAVWFFFHDYFDRIMKNKFNNKKEENQE
jgi:O-antigen/teichoic acid export membrane protein